MQTTYQRDTAAYEKENQNDSSYAAGKLSIVVCDPDLFELLATFVWTDVFCLSSYRGIYVAIYITCAYFNRICFSIAHLNKTWTAFFCFVLCVGLNLHRLCINIMRGMSVIQSKFANRVSCKQQTDWSIFEYSNWISE